MDEYWQAGPPVGGGVGEGGWQLILTVAVSVQAGPDWLLVATLMV